ncbi:hypothetical protein M0Q50_04545 [bacterium]|jgi:hypothetical protein|nr:hypothetical protein [bacterium]
MITQNNFFKNFKKEYLEQLFMKYKEFNEKDIILIIKKDMILLKTKHNLLKLHERNIQYWLVRGWSENESVDIMLKNKENRKKPRKNSSRLSRGYWLEKGFNEEESIKIVSEIQKKNGKSYHDKRKENPENYKKILSPFTEEFWIKRGIFDKNEIKNKIKSQRKLNIEYWINKGFTIDESKIKVSEYQSENSNKRIIKHDDKKDTYEYRKKYNICIEYYLDKGFTEEESIELLKKRQTTFTLEKCIIKYGEEDGKMIYEKRQNDWVKKMFNENTCISTGRSMISDKFIEEIINEINNKEITDNFLYGKNEKFIYDKIEKKPNRFDLCYNKKIIEFNGDFWHSNPKIFGPDEIHRVKKIKCSDIWKIDERKIESVKEHGYEILVIWESDYINNKKEIIKNSIKFLNI